eukprot:1731397-Rhodomonas_salina.1
MAQKVSMMEQELTAAQVSSPIPSSFSFSWVLLAVALRSNCCLFLFFLDGAAVYGGCAAVNDVSSAHKRGRSAICGCRNAILGGSGDN